MSEAAMIRLWGKSSDRAGLPDGSSYPLLGHLLDTAAAAGAVCDKLIPGPARNAMASHAGVSWQQWRSETVLLAGLHDTGKADCAFQNLSPADCDDRIKGLTSLDPRHGWKAKRYKQHAYASFLLVWDASLAWRVPNEARVRAAQIVGGHHGVVPAWNDKLDRRAGAALLDVAHGGHVAELLNAARERLFEVVSTTTATEMNSCDFKVPAAAISLAVVVLADWLVSQQRFLVSQASDHGLQVDDPTEWFAAAEHRVSNVTLPDAGLLRAAPASVTAAALVPAGTTPSGLQVSIEQHHPRTASGITFIKAPTGDGKTEAALIAASRYATARETAGWFFAMPTRGTADGLFNRLESALPAVTAASCDSQLRLSRVHGMSRLHPVSAHTGDGRQWLSGTRKALLAPFGVGTIDQILMAAMPMRHSPVRMLATAMAGCVIVDEAHSFDWYMQELLIRAVEWLGALQVPVAVVSATLPQTRIGALAAAYHRGAVAHLPKPDQPRLGDVPECGYPGWLQWSPDATGRGRWSHGEADPQRPGWTLTVEVDDVAAADTTRRVAQRASDAARSGGCVLVVRETVAKAQQTYDAVLDTGSVTKDEVVLVHSRFRHRDRQRIEQDLVDRLGPPGADRERPARLVVVATQVVELSLDVDFDTVITDPAPFGALIQRAGRSHRHRRSDRPAVHHEPRVAVVWPRGGNGPSYRSPVYMEHDLRVCREILAEHSRIAVPGDVPELIERAAAVEPAAETGEAAWLEWLADADIKKGEARKTIIPAPDRRASGCLDGVTSPQDEDHITPTRLGVPTALVLPVYDTHDAVSATPDGPPLPEYPTPEQERELVAACVPVPRYPHSARWLNELDPPPRPKGRRSAWKSGPLAHARLMRCTHDPTVDASVAELSDCTVDVTPTRGLGTHKDGKL